MKLVEWSWLGPYLRLVISSTSKLNDFVQSTKLLRSEAQYLRKEFVCYLRNGEGVYHAKAVHEPGYELHDVFFHEASQCPTPPTDIIYRPALDNWCVLC